MKLGTLLYKSICGNLSTEEEEELQQWISASEANAELLTSLRQMHERGVDLSDLNTLDAASAWENISQRQKESRSKKKKSFPILRYAAVFVGLLALTYGYWKYDHPSGQPLESNLPEGITLDLGNGRVIPLSPQQQEKIKDAEGILLGVQKGEQLDYSQGDETDKLVYNTLRIPNGKRFEIVLSDGSTVHLNSGSSLKYPAKFLRSGNRQVYLTGEAFFEVSKDPEHPFIVNSNGMDVKVLGTKFNVSAYPEDTIVNTVLVEGSVRLGSQGFEDGESTLLEPGYKAAWDRTKHSATTEKVETDLYTGWMQGKLVIRKMGFDDILKKLERHYNVQITNRNKSLSQRVFTGTFDVETIEEVLNTFVAETYFEYRVEGSSITIMETKKQPEPMKKE